MTIRCTTEEAREYVARELGTGQELPRDVDFGHVSNHFAAAAIFAAMGAPKQEHNISLLYVSFRNRAPSWFDIRMNYTRAQRTQDAQRTIDTYEEEATERVRKAKCLHILDGVQFASANQWRFDNGPKDVYAVNAVGSIALVATMGGYVTPEDEKLWPTVLSTIEAGIKTEFDI